MLVDLLKSGGDFLEERQVHGVKSLRPINSDSDDPALVYFLNF